MPVDIMTDAVCDLTCPWILSQCILLHHWWLFILLSSIFPEKRTGRSGSTFSEVNLLAIVKTKVEPGISCCLGWAWHVNPQFPIVDIFVLWLYFFGKALGSTNNIPVIVFHACSKHFSSSLSPILSVGSSVFNKWGADLSHIYTWSKTQDSTSSRC